MVVTCEVVVSFTWLGRILCTKLSLFVVLEEVIDRQFYPHVIQTQSDMSLWVEGS